MLPVVSPPPDKSQKQIGQSPQKPKPSNQRRLIFTIISFILLFALSKKVPFLEKGEDGIFHLSKTRKAKFEKELNKLNEAEQYALEARQNGWYQCFSCSDTNFIFLLSSEIWKYGVTINGENGRYGKVLPVPSLQYVVQFKGSLQECLEEEKRKIYNYAILPENLNRQKPLIRPPGNKRDN